MINKLAAADLKSSNLASKMSVQDKRDMFISKYVDIPGQENAGETTTCIS